MKLRFVMLLTLTILFTTLSGQIVHHEIWSRLFVNHELNNKYKIEFEYQFRIQDKPYSVHFPDTKLAHVARIWLYRKAGNNWRFGLSPFAVFRNYPTISIEEDLTKSCSWEFRFSANAEYTLKKGSFGFRIRSGLEQRLTKPDNKNEWNNSIRMRNRIQVDYNLSLLDSALAPLTIFLGDEHFFRTEDLIKNEPCFDQNRIFLGGAWKFNKHFTISTLAYLIHRPGNAGYNQHRMLWLNLIIEI